MDSAGKLLITVKPGPVLIVWRDGAEIARVPLPFYVALGLVQDVLEHLRPPR